MTDWDLWMDEVDRLGVEAGVFDPPHLVTACSGSRPRRPYRGEEGMFRLLFNSGVPASMALGEALTEDDGQLN